MNTIQMSPVNTLALMNSNKTQRKSFCLQIIEAIENGEVDPLQCHVYLKNLEAIFKTLTDEKTGKDFADRYKSAILAAAEKEGGKAFEKYNAKFQIKEAGTSFDWSKCEDVVLNNLMAQQEEITKKVKERQEFLKMLPDSGLVITDQESGETYTAYRPAKSSTTTVSVTLN